MSLLLFCSVCVTGECSDAHDSCLNCFVTCFYSCDSDALMFYLNL